MMFSSYRVFTRFRSSDALSTGWIDVPYPSTARFSTTFIFSVRVPAFPSWNNQFTVWKRFSSFSFLTNEKKGKWRDKPNFPASFFVVANKTTKVFLFVFEFAGCTFWMEWWQARCQIESNIKRLPTADSKRRCTCFTFKGSSSIRKRFLILTIICIQRRYERCRSESVLLYWSTTHLFEQRRTGAHKPLKKRWERNPMMLGDTSGGAKGS